MSELKKELFLLKQDTSVIEIDNLYNDGKTFLSPLSNYDIDFIKPLSKVARNIVYIDFDSEKEIEEEK